MPIVTRLLTDQFVRHCKHDGPGDRTFYRDKKVPALLLMVTARGAKSYTIRARIPPQYIPSTRKLGDAHALALTSARTMAREYADLIERGIDPELERRRRERDAEQVQANTFAAVCEAWLAQKVRGKLVKSAEIERDMRRIVVAAWGDRPITELRRRDVRDLITNIKETPHQARNILMCVKQMFRWAVDADCFGIDQSPAEGIRPTELLGRKVARKRVLNDRELRAVWRAAESMPYPYGHLFQFMILTGQRESECAEARWREFDLPKRLWLIPPERMKMDAAHVVPLADDALALLASLPRFAGRGNDCLFSQRAIERPPRVGKRGEPLKDRRRRGTAPLPVPGAKPVNGFSKAKRRLDEAVARELGEPPVPFVLHDLRRSMRTNLSALPIEHAVREAMIAHKKVGIHAVYDQFDHADEKRRGFELWEARLRGIVDQQPRPDNVVLAQFGRSA